MDISEADDAVELALERPSESNSSAGAGIGTESTMSCALLNALDRNSFRSSRGASSKSIGPRVFKESWRAAMLSMVP
jgi:hypothetical protein